MIQQIRKKPEIPAISSTQFTLFRASKACQTDKDEVQETKQLAEKLNYLVLELKDSAFTIQSAYESQIARLAAGIVDRLENRNAELKREYKAAKERVDRSSRTELSNGIATIWRQYESKYQTIAGKHQSDHKSVIATLDVKIKEYKRTRITNEAAVAKNNLSAERWAKMAKKKGFDLVGHYNEDKIASSQVDILENLQKSLAAKSEQFASLTEQYNLEIERRNREKRVKSAEIRKQFRAASASKWKSIRTGSNRAFSFTSRGSVMSRQPSMMSRSTLSSAKSNTRPSSFRKAPSFRGQSSTEPDGAKPYSEDEDIDLTDIEKYDYEAIQMQDQGGPVAIKEAEVPPNIDVILAQMEQEFEKEKEEELRKTRELEEELKSKYAVLRAQAIKSKGISPVLLKHNKAIFSITKSLFVPAESTIE